LFEETVNSRSSFRRQVRT